VGFVEPSTVVRDHQVRFADPRQWIDWSLSHGQRYFWELIPKERIDDVRTTVLARLETLREPDGSLLLNQTVRYTVARARSADRWG
jgi:hypothetical protein